ncbi:MAG: EAL domain-containing protein [Lachnospiraceae bacterium]|nr:EAL domain-containing protein [Lachnospiraceae bacterium]
MSTKNRIFTDEKNNQNFIKNGLNAMPGGFFIYRADESEEILYANPEVLELFDCENEEEFMSLTGGCFPGLVFPDDLEEVQRSIDDQISTGFDQVNYRIKTRKGRVFMVEDYGRLVKDPEMGPLYYVFIAPEKTKQDLLTGLLNMNYFIKVSEVELKKQYDMGNRPLIISFNLSGMKRFNTKYGRKEGDRLLVTFADILKRRFGLMRCSRFGEDHFYAYINTDNIESELNGLMVELHEVNEGRTLPVKIGITTYDPEISIAEVCDRAKIACDSLRKSSYGSSYKWFDDGMLEKYNIQQHILENIDRALSLQWINVFMQPVVRALSGKVCSVEALARWNDPELGMISPGVFVPLLEEYGLSYKLDFYIANRVAEFMARRMRNGEVVVPVSINLSRVDFETTDPVEQMIRIAEEHGVRRSLFVIEITESALIDDDGVIKSAIKRFHEEGFEVWMDDFGSGFSSLNALKDYDFDEIKLDMIFMKGLGQRSKDIITSTVQMAKKLGIHTLAEGVETVEQLYFLKQIGCEKIQGYYYGRPMLPAEVTAHMRIHGLEVESREMSAFYSKAGLVDVISDKSNGLFLFDGERFDILYLNKIYEDLIHRPGLTNQEMIDREMNNPNSDLRKRFRILATNARRTKKEEHMSFTSAGEYYHLTFKVVATSRLAVVLQASLDKISIDDRENVNMMEKAVRNLISVYDSIYLYDIERDSRTVIVSNIVDEKAGDVIYGLEAFYGSDKQYRIFHPDDLEKVRKLRSPKYIKEKLNVAGRGSFGGICRVKNENGNYTWTEIRIIAIPETNQNSYLLCLSPSELEDMEEKDKIVDVVSKYMNSDALLETVYMDEEKSMTDQDFLKALIRDSSIKFFWKDKNRRFLGASNAFLAYYGFSSIAEILGKTDEEIGWHVEDDTFKNYEEEILKKGKVIDSALGQNVLGGTARGISASKFPIYHNNKICGLMGYFFDVEQDIVSKEDIMTETTTDPVTGFLNIKGIMQSVLSYDDIYRTGHQDYIYINIEVTTYDHVKADYGEEVANLLLRKVGELIAKHFEIGAMIGRALSNHFIICSKEVEDEIILEKLEKLREDVKQIREVDDRACQVDIIYGMAKGSEGHTVQDVVYLTRERQNAINGEREKEEIIEILPDVYRDFPIPYFINRLKKGEIPEQDDYEFIYVNQKFCELSGRSKEELIGHGYYECFPFSGEKWKEFCKQVIQGGFARGRAYVSSIGQWMEYIMAPVTSPGCFITILLADVEKKFRERLQTGHATDELIIRIAQTLAGENDRVLAVRKALEKLGRAMESDRMYAILMEDSEVTFSEEWCEDGVSPFNEVFLERGEKDRTAWRDVMEGRGIASFDNISNLKEMYPELYHLAKMREARNFMLAPIRDNDGELIGCLGVDNYNPEKTLDNKRLMEICSFFVSVRLLVDMLK